jgi:hypothetical protein
MTMNYLEKRIKEWLAAGGQFRASNFRRKTFLEGIHSSGISGGILTNFSWSRRSNTLRRRTYQHNSDSYSQKLYCRILEIKRSNPIASTISTARSNTTGSYTID